MILLFSFILLETEVFVVQGPRRPCVVYFMGNIRLLLRLGLFV